MTPLYPNTLTKDSGHTHVSSYLQHTWQSALLTPASAPVCVGGWVGVGVYGCVCVCVCVCVLCVREGVCVRARVRACVRTMSVRRTRPW